MDHIETAILNCYGIKEAEQNMVFAAIYTIPKGQWALLLQPVKDDPAGCFFKNSCRSNTIKDI